jgi:porin
MWPPIVTATFACAGGLLSSSAVASPTLQVSGYANIDVVSVSGPESSRVVEIDKEQLNFDLDLGRSEEQGTTAHLSLLNASGSAPNEIAGTLQGVNNLEVATEHPRLFEVWVDHHFLRGRVSVRAGLYDTNSEFDVTPSSGLLFAPAFGISSEFAGGGPPSYPTSSLAVRLEIRPRPRVYARVAVANAVPRALGDPGGIDTRFEAGVVAMGEVGIDGDNQLALGVWRFSRRRDDVFAVDVLGEPRQRAAQGIYLLAARRIIGSGEGFSVTGFLRAGAADGRTTPFAGALQTGVLATHVIAGRPDSALSAGVAVGVLGSAYRAASEAGGARLQTTETQVEVTYADNLAPHLQIQPDLQYTFNPGGRPGGDGAFVASLRFTLSYGGD